MMRRQKDTVKEKEATTCVHIYACEMRRGCSLAVGRRLRQAHCGAKSWEVSDRRNQEPCRKTGSWHQITKARVPAPAF